MSGNQDPQIESCASAIHAIATGSYLGELPTAAPGAIGRLGREIASLAEQLRAKQHKEAKLAQIIDLINHGFYLETCLERTFQEMKGIIPFDRLGLATISLEAMKVHSYWVKSELPTIKLRIGYSANLGNSSLAEIIRTGKPRVINDLLKYLEEKPESVSTRLIIEEGMRSSLTCLLKSNDTPIGFLFFSSTKLGAYEHEHVDFFQAIANRLAIILEKGLLVSQLREQRDQIEARNTELERLNKYKTKFVSMAAHDLGGPIAYIRSASDMVLESCRTWTDPEQLELLRAISRKAKQMSKLLQDLLDISRIEIGNFELTPVNCNVQEVLAEVIEENLYFAQSKGSRIEVDNTFSGIVVADKNRLRQILDNLLSNALKYSPPESCISVSVTPHEEHWCFNVTDQGPGITLEDREKLFEEFSRLSNKPTFGEPSNGLGLAICKQLVEAHGGTIDVESAPGYGARFWFTIPKSELIPD